ncbi:uncharacterized protein LOC143572782 [Bidens hawaiensis]|uniref:uncharacterized protein LOC143572782 n=1 Tax=Bidens hawaiensis TaxID=980011 RepID=UPI004049970C
MVDTVWNWSRVNLSATNLADLDDLHQMAVSYLFHAGKGDRWRWIGDGSGSFTVHGMRGVMAESLYGDDTGSLCSWDSWIPIRINCFIWRLLQHRVPVAVNLLARGMSSVPPNCLCCVSVEESVNHVFLDCSRAKEIWRAVSIWSGYDVTGFESLSQLVQVAEFMGRRILKAIIFVSMWFIWKQRNARTFVHRGLSTYAIMEEIILNLFGWIKSRSSYKDIVWLDWINSPLSVVIG